MDATQAPQYFDIVKFPMGTYIPIDCVVYIYTSVIHIDNRGMWLSVVKVVPLSYVDLADAYIYAPLLSH